MVRRLVIMRTTDKTPAPFLCATNYALCLFWLTSTLSASAPPLLWTRFTLFLLTVYSHMRGYRFGSWWFWKNF